MSDKIQKSKLSIVEHSTGTNVTVGNNISVHLGKDGLIDVNVNGKTVYTGPDQERAAHDVKSAIRVTRLYEDD